MIKKVIRFYKDNGLKKTLARSFLELSMRLGHDVDGSSSTGKGSLHTSKIGESPSVNILSLFREKIMEIKNPLILELGSRVVTKESLRHMLELNFPHEYKGLDIHEGPNVEIVGDAHDLSFLFPEEHFDVVMSKAVFEHLAMPWKVVLEINKILKHNGLLFINTLHTYPLHEKPWDFWRFSEEAWKILLNKWTGFEIIYTNMEFPCKVVPEFDTQDWIIDHEAYLLANVLAKKIGNYDRELFKWDIKVRDITESTYPKKQE